MEIRDLLLEDLECIQQKYNELKAVVDYCSDQELKDNLTARFSENAYHIVDTLKFMKMIITREDEDGDRTKMTNKELKVYFEENWDHTIGVFLLD